MSQLLFIKAFFTGPLACSPLAGSILLQTLLLWFWADQTQAQGCMSVTVTTLKSKNSSYLCTEPRGLILLILLWLFAELFVSLYSVLLLSGRLGRAIEETLALYGGSSGLL